MRSKAPLRQPSTIWHPPSYTTEDTRALQHLAAYMAGLDEEPPTPETVKRAFDWIIEKACSNYDDPFRPGEPDVRDYMLGRRSVALAIIKQFVIKPEKLNERNPGGGS